MKIAFFGSSLVSAYWNGAATYYRGVIRALNARGHRTTFYEPDAFDRQAHRDLDNPDWADVVVYEANHDSVMSMVAAAKGADLVIKASGVGVFDELLESAVLELQTPSTLVAFWDVDAPATLDRVMNHPNDPFRSLIPRYSAIFTYGGGRPVVDAYLKLGAQECVPIYNALDPQEHYPVGAHSSYLGDLAFLGNRLPDREARVEEFFFKPAEILTSRIFLLGGAGWTDRVRSSNIRYFDHVYTRDHNSFNSSPRAVLNISRASMARYGYSPATRVFEAAGAAACIITDFWEGIPQFLEPDEEILVARDSEQVVEIVESLTDQRAREIGCEAYRRILAYHTYAHRAEQLEAVLEGIGQSDSAVPA